MDVGGGSGTNEEEEEEEEEDNKVDDLTLARLALSLKEFSSAKHHANHALESNLLSFIDKTRFYQVLAIADVHIAAAAGNASEPRRGIDNRTIHDWYAVLQLGKYDLNIFSPDLLSFRYRHLAHLLDPKDNHFAYASSALKLVSEGYSVLSDPVKKSLYDDQIRTANKSSSHDNDNDNDDDNSPPSTTFWTVCRSCFCVHQYGWVQKGRDLRCPVCKKMFVADELPVEPTVVEGTDMYHCIWGFFPVGFPDGYRFQTATPPKVEKRVLSENTETPPPPPTKRPRQRQTARKTVRPVNFNTKSERIVDKEEER